MVDELLRSHIKVFAHPMSQGKYPPPLQKGSMFAPTKGGINKLTVALFTTAICVNENGMKIRGTLNLNEYTWGRWRKHSP